MDNLMKKKIHVYYLISAIYMIVSIVLGLILKDDLVLFLAWNMLLATIVFFLSEVLVFLYEKRAHLWMLMVFFALWLLFFPNTIYMLTDFIHIQNYTFFWRYADLYNYSLTEWIVFTHILIGALYAAKLGFSAIKKIEPIIKKHTVGYYYLILVTIFFLSSFGIFIGRFLRFNTWNIFELITNIGMVFSHGTFLVGFVSIFFVIHWFVYFLFSNQEQKIYNIDNKPNSEE